MIHQKRASSDRTQTLHCGLNINEVKCAVYVSSGSYCASVAMETGFLCYSHIFPLCTYEIVVRHDALEFGPGLRSWVRPLRSFRPASLRRGMRLSRRLTEVKKTFDLPPAQLDRVQSVHLQPRDDRAESQQSATLFNKPSCTRCWSCCSYGITRIDVVNVCAASASH